MAEIVLIDKARISPACAGNTPKKSQSNGAIPDQPRVRGEHVRRHVQLHRVEGSAPRARGTREGVELLGVLQRISPACAGNTSHEHLVIDPEPDQPRVRGEHSVAPGRRRLQKRISPACAGNTSNGWPERPPTADQPRVCGEHRRKLEVDHVVGGSAPRARGTHTAAGWGANWGRISPACAGNTSRDAACPVERPDQPRVRGEHLVVGKEIIPIRGSAPRARGTQPAAVPARVLRRISPACAGNTLAMDHWPAAHADQPRVRGEHGGSSSPGCHAVGSAPRARGTLGEAALDGEGHRISPACAGNTDRKASRGNPRTDQPRVRGEHEAQDDAHDGDAGSAPRARGTPETIAAVLGMSRISPACAGNTGLTVLSHAT